MIVSDSNKFIFIHIYKTGGSSMNTLLMPYISEKFRFKSKNPRTKGSLWQSDWHVEGLQHSKFAENLQFLDKSNLDLNEYFKFVFVRNPYTWILSIWNNFYQSPRRNLPDNLKNNLKFMVRGLFNKKMDSQHFFEMYPDGSFKNFVLFINEIVSNNPQLAQTAWGASDQYSFIENDRDIQFDFIGKLENFQEDINKITSLIKVEQPSEIPDKGRYAKNRLKKKNYLEYYDKQSIEIINKVFIRDFQAFGYQQIEI